MQIDLLGSTVIRIPGEPSQEVRASKVRAMLATLALDVGRTVSCSELADELWGERPIGNVGNALQANATRLRKVLDALRPGSRHGSGPELTSQAPLVRSVHNGYMLDLPSESVDAVRFQRLAREGATQIREDPRRAIELFECALDLWRGSALVDAGDGVRCRSAAARLEQARLTVWEDLVTARIILREGRVVIGHLRQLIEQHPLHERFCEQLMLALYRSGQQGDALASFHRLRRQLDDDLGVTPGKSIRLRYNEILSQDPGLFADSVVWRWRDEFTRQQ